MDARDRRLTSGATSAGALAWSETAAVLPWARCEDGSQDDKSG